jgi:hypothetical protein
MRCAVRADTARLLTCIGVVPVTLVNSRRSIPGTIVKKRSPPPASGSPSTTRSLEARQATHAEYAGMLVFRNQFDGELPAVEYPKIGVCPQCCLDMILQRPGDEEAEDGKRRL